MILKWLMTLGMIYGGSAYLGPWSTAMLEMSRDMGIAALENSEYLDIQTLVMNGHFICLVLYLVSIVLSVYKPWEQKEVRRQFGLASPE